MFLALVDAGLQQFVDRRIDAADEDAVDRTNPVDRQAFIDAPLQAADKRLRGFFIELDCEDQRHVDVDAFGDALFYRRNALFGARNFHHEVRPVHALPKVLGHRNGTFGVVSEQG